MTIKALYLGGKRKRPNFKIAQTVSETGVLEAGGIFLKVIHKYYIYP